MDVSCKRQNSNFNEGSMTLSMITLDAEYRSLSLLCSLALSSVSWRPSS